MSGPALLHTISFLALVAVILLMVWVVLVLESGGHARRKKRPESRQFFGDDLDT